MRTSSLVWIFRQRGKLAGLGSGGLVVGLLHRLHRQVSASSFLFFFFSIPVLLFVV
jgi:hypothetical protein